MTLSALAAGSQISLLVDVEAVHALAQTTDDSPDGHWAVVFVLDERHIPGHSRISLEDHDGSPLLKRHQGIRYQGMLSIPGKRLAGNTYFLTSWPRWLSFC